MIHNLALLITDTHLSEDTIDLNRSIWDQAIKVCIERGLKKIYHLGDVFDSRKSQTQELLIVLDELLDKVSQSGLEIIIIPGNHDKTSYTSSKSFLYTYRFHPNVTIVENFYSETSLSNPLLSPNMIIMFYPFFDEKSGEYGNRVKANNLVSKLSDYKQKLLLTHIGVDRAIMNSREQISEHLDSGVFDEFDRVYIGHYHDYQELNSGKIVYIGSSYQGNFGENNKKGFQILKSDGSLEFIQSSFPEYKKIVIDINSSTKEELVELKKEYQNSSDRVRFIFKGDREKLSTVDKNDYTSLGIDVKMEESVVEILDYTQQVTTFTQESIKEEWNEFTKNDRENHDLGLKYLNN